MHYLRPDHTPAREDAEPEGPGVFEQRHAPLRRDYRERAYTIGIGGPVGSGKTALLLALCRLLRDDYNIAVVTNDIFTREDMEFLVRSEALRNGISLQTQLAGDLPQIEGDRIQLQQVILNLIVNAVEAMASLDEG